MVFGDLNENNNTDQDDNETADNEGFLDADPLFDGPVDTELVERFPWEDLDDQTADEIEEEVDNRLCDHDEHKQVVPNQGGGGATFAGSGIQATTPVNKTVCTKCGGEWDTRDGSQQSQSDPWSL